MLYDKFIELFDAELNKLKITKDKRYCVPGNHDVSVTYVKKNFVIHEGIVAQSLVENKYNDFINENNNILVNKFDNYKSFEERFASNGISDKILSGKGFLLENNIGIYCVNSATFSSGGYNDISDKGRLGIDTRSLYKWIHDCKANIKILVMHHTLDFLTDWARIELDKVLIKEFSLCISGHIHSQSAYHLINDSYSLVKCSAPPLLINKKGELGYSIISVSESGVKEIQYRQWTKNYTFVSGVNFSDNDDGRIKIKKNIKYEIRDTITKILNDNLNHALRSFNSQPIFWVEPYLCNTNEIDVATGNEKSAIVDIQNFVLNPESTIIQAPPQYGLTCLAHYFVKIAWENDYSFWLYLDASQLKPSNIDQEVKKILRRFELDMTKVACVILDSWNNYSKESFQVLQKISDLFKRIPLIVMQTIDDSKFLLSTNKELYERTFNIIYLHALTRNHVRKVVSSYNNYKKIGDEDIVTSKVVTDLEVLNIPRTPLNCLTLLKVSEGYFEESPINRTKMLEMILFLLFNVDNIPTYKTKPDLKDCEYVLGRYCEKMIREKIDSFSRIDFLNEIKKFCDERLIDLEVEVVFDVLYANNILIKYEDKFVFRFAFWVYYFCANRMHHDKSFADFMLSNRTYVAFPEIIEFYTGIDRSRDDALKLLIDDLVNISNTVNLKVGLPDGMNPYKHLKYSPSEETIKKMKEEINENVQVSNLPDIVKDQHADKFYDPSRPYNQSVNRIIEDYSIVLLVQSIKASSRALRNSDYVNPEIKRKLLKEIICGWEQISKVIFAIAPLLALKGNVIFDGTLFRLASSFGEEPTDRLIALIENIPYNVVNIFKKDIFSHKMGTLLYDCIQNETNEINKHELILLIIYERPVGWKKQLEEYIISLPTNSFFLYNIIHILRIEWYLSFAPKHTLKEIEYLIKLGIAKHSFNVKKPGIDKITKIKFK